MSDILTSTDSEPLLAAMPLFEAPAETIPVTVKHEKHAAKTKKTVAKAAQTAIKKESAKPESITANGFMDTVRATASRYVWTMLILVLFGCAALSVELIARTRIDAINHAASVSIASSQAAMLKATAGLDMMVPTSQLQSKMSAITAQPVTLAVGTHQVSVAGSTIKGWIQVTPSSNGSESYLHINTASMINSLTDAAKSFVVAPVNQVSVTHTDGVTPSGVILYGENGTGLSDPSTIVTQAKQVERTVMNGTGLQFSTPLSTVPYQSVTPSAFGKLLEVNVVTKRMYAYENGQLVRTFLVSAGKPSTPTPLGIFHIWDKTPDQTMTGPGYVQPNVHWINYFDHNGDAVHGNYWRPASVFGNVNTSHGCVGIPDDQAEWVYDWAPIGTTVINYD